MPNYPTFLVSTKIVTGPGSLSALPDELASFAPRRVALVADRGLADLGMLDTVTAEIRQPIASTFLVDPEPGIAVVDHSAQTARSAGADLVIVVGGGSALAVGKATAILLTNPVAVTDLENQTTVPHDPAPTIAIPTTAGSGSEVSKVLVLHDPTRTTDLTLRIERSQPNVAILDAKLLRAAPRSVLLYAGLDALSHGIESLWARRATFFTRTVAYSAIDSLMSSLPLALQGAVDGSNRAGSNDGVLMQLLDAATAANIACGNSGMGLAHALAATPAVDLPHGQRVGIMLPHVAAFNSPAIEDEEARRLMSLIDSFYDTIDFTPQFPDGSVTTEQARYMIQATVGHPFRTNNARNASDEDIESLLIQAGALPALSREVGV